MAANNQAPPYKYINDLSKEEKQVQAMGYPWVTTNHLSPGGELARHSHNSANTHLIVEGSLTISSRRNGRDAQTYQPGEHANQAACNSYIGRANSIQGCSFVEGHAMLSPTTRDRIERNDVAKAIRNDVNIGRNSTGQGAGASVDARKTS